MTEKVDFKKLDRYRAARGKFRLIDIPDAAYLMIDGHGDPNTSPEFAEALKALYPVAYKLKFLSKLELERDYVVPPLEGLWWADDMDAFTVSRDKSRWNWTMMLHVPDWLDETHFRTAFGQAGTKSAPARLADVRFAGLAEGSCVQTLHIGAFDDEGAVLEAMHNGFIPDQGLKLSGRHHEIYLSDFRRVAPEKQRTILRQPVSAAGS